MPGVLAFVWPCLSFHNFVLILGHHLAVEPRYAI
jgi:hypothetical protein